MKKILTFSLYSLFASAAIAAPLREADLASSATWFAHVDFDALRQGIAGQVFREDFPKEHGPFSRLQQEIGFDARVHLDGVTVQGFGVRKEGAILVRHHFENAKLVEWLKKKNYAATPGADGKEYFAVPARDWRVQGGKTLVAFPQEGVVIIAANEDWLDKATARAAAGEAVAHFPEFYRAPVAALGTAPVFSAFADISAVKTQDGNVSPWGQRVRQIALATGAKGADAKISVRAETTAPEVAENAAEMLRSFFVAQTPRFPALETADIASKGDLLTVEALIPIAQLRAGLAAERKKLENKDSSTHE